MVNYMIRLDDACPYMSRAKWQRMEDILNRYNIKPLVGVIPANADPLTMPKAEDEHFWEKVRQWKENEWSFALHGYDHVYISNDGLSGMNPMWRRSEFAGVPIHVQREKIKKGYDLMKQYGIEPYCFFAPSHTFDKNTLEALKQETSIRMVSDTIGRYPYKYGDFIFVPQISGHCSVIPLSGLYTFCFHPNNMDEVAFLRLEQFLDKYAQQFVRFDQIDLKNIGEKRLFDKVLSWLFFKYRLMRGLQ